MRIVFCLDRKMLDGLHVTAYTVLQHYSGKGGPAGFEIFSQDLQEGDIELLERTLQPLEKEFTLRLHPVDHEPFRAFPSLNNSLATYYRLVVPDLLEVDRYIYLDVDLLCRVDLADLYDFDLKGRILGLVPEAPLASCIDQTARGLLGPKLEGDYYNAGVTVLDAQRWREADLTRQCLEFVADNRPQFHDQSAMNVLLRDQILELPGHYNLRTNARENWRAIVSPAAGTGSILHFIDYPKPWDPFAALFHPMGSLWLSCLRKTAIYGHPDLKAVRKLRPFPVTRKSFTGYLRAGKDKLLFSLYRAGILKRVKGMPVNKE